MTIQNISIIFALVLFCTGFFGILLRRSMIFMLISTEIMLNAAGFMFIVAGAKWSKADGQVMFIFLLIVAAAEAAIGLALVLKLAKKINNLDAEQLYAKGGE